MERPIQTVERLVGALEILASQETILLADESWSELAAVQEKAVTLVDRLTVLMADNKVHFGLPPEIFARARAIADSQGIKIAHLELSMAATDEELQSLIASQQRMRSMKPAYRNRFQGDDPNSFNGLG